MRLTVHHSCLTWTLTSLEPLELIFNQVHLDKLTTDLMFLERLSPLKSSEYYILCHNNSSIPKILVFPLKVSSWVFAAGLNALWVIWLQVHTSLV